MKLDGKRLAFLRGTGQTENKKMRLPSGELIKDVLLERSQQIKAGDSVELCAEVLVMEDALTRAQRELKQLRAEFEEQTINLIEQAAKRVCKYCSKYGEPDDNGAHQIKGQPHCMARELWLWIDELLEKTT